MYGESHGKIPKDLTSVLWADAEIDEISIDFDSISIQIKESTGLWTTILCEGYIGYQVIGFWDESVVESGIVTQDHPFIAHCLGSIQNRYKRPPPPTGNAARDRGKWCALVITLIDGSEIVIACGDTKALKRDEDCSADL
jgi:hypothetical protein